MFDSNQFFGAQAEEGFYPETLDGSLRFNDNDSAYLSKVLSSSGNRRTWTFSCWVKRGNLGVVQNILNASDSGTEYLFMTFPADDTIQIYGYPSSTLGRWQTSQVFRDVGAWYHIVWTYDTTQATQTDRIKLWVNGSQITAWSEQTGPALNAEGNINSASTVQYLGYSNYGAFHPLDGYLSNVHFIDGTALDADSFGETKSGVWIPKAYTGSYGTNGFHLPLDADANDDSGNGNNWTQNNLAATDYVLDSPTNNFATLNVLDQYAGNASFQEGNLKVAPTGDNDWDNWQATIPVSSGKWYAEFLIGSNDLHIVGINDATTRFDSHVGDAAGSYGYYGDSGNKYNNGIGSAYGATFTTGDIIGVALDLDAGTLVFYKNNSSQGTAFTGISGEFVFAGSSKNSGEFEVLNFGQDSSFAGNKTAQGNRDANGIGDFYYTPPSGYLALCTSNLPEPAFSPVDDASPQDHFNTVLYTGDGTTSNSVSGVGFQPDFVWLKHRNHPTNHSNNLLDAVRGATKVMYTNTLDDEQTITGSLTSFDADGFTVSNNAAVNDNTYSYVSWNWKANGSGASNTDGSTTSTVSANTDAGFSIVNWGGNNATATIGHGLSSAPEVIIVKERLNAGTQWRTYTATTGASKYLTLNSSDASITSSDWNNTAPTDSVFSVGAASSGDTNWTGRDYIGYCFHSVEGFSKFGSYTGNGSDDGTFTYTGFLPSFVLIKRTDSTGNWQLFDSKRDEYNESKDRALYPNLGNAEDYNFYGVDLVSNGFKMRYNDSNLNVNGASYIFMAFSENPFKYSTGA